MGARRVWNWAATRDALTVNIIAGVLVALVFLGWNKLGGPGVVEVLPWLSVALLVAVAGGTIAVQRRSARDRHAHQIQLTEDGDLIVLADEPIRPPQPPQPDPAGKPVTVAIQRTELGVQWAAFRPDVAHGLEAGYGGGGTPCMVAVTLQSNADHVLDDVTFRVKYGGLMAELTSRQRFDGFDWRNAGVLPVENRDDVVRNVGSIAPGETVTLKWLVDWRRTYPFETDKDRPLWWLDAHGTPVDSGSFGATAQR